MPILRFDSYERTRLRKIAQSCKPGAILDLGYAQYPNPYLSGLHRTGVDLTPSRGKVRYEEELIGDVTDLDGLLGSRVFDTIVAGEIIEHVEKPYGFLRSLRRFLKADGRLVLSTPNPVGWPCILFEWSRSRRFYYSEEHRYYFAPRWMERMLVDTGYLIEEVKGVGLLSPFVTLPCPAAFSYQVLYMARLADTEHRAPGPPQL